MKTSVWVLLAICLTGCGRSGPTHADRLTEPFDQRLTGTWAAETQVPQGRVLEETVVDHRGHYVKSVTNVFADGIRTAKVEGILSIRDGVLTETITNSFGANTRVPRTGLMMSIAHLSERELVLRDTNTQESLTYSKRKQDPALTE